MKAISVDPSGNSKTHLFGIVPAVRNCWVTKDREDAGFWDSAQWEEVKKKGPDAIHRWIDAQLAGTSVTAVLIGAETSSRPYIDFEITESHKKGNGMLRIYIHNIKDTNSRPDVQGANPFAKWTFKDGNGNVITYPTYDWVSDSGPERAQPVEGACGIAAASRPLMVRGCRERRRESCVSGPS